MKIKIKNINHIMSSCYCVFLVCFMIFATDTLMFKTNENSLPRYCSWAFICAFSVICPIVYGLNKNMRQVLTVGFFILVNMIITMDFTGGYVFKIILLIFGVYFTKIISWKKFRDLYIKIMLVLAIFSIVCFFLAPYIIGFDFIPEISNGNFDFKCLFITNVIKVPGYIGYIPVYRNYGPFWEPGVFQIYLVLAIVLCMFGRVKANWIAICIFLLTILTTLSTAGCLLAGITILTFLFKKGNSKVKRLVVVLMVIAVLVFCKNGDLFHFVFGKMSSGTSMQHSTDSRWYSIWSNIYIALTNPFGVGPNNLEAYMTEFCTVFRIERSFSNINMLLQNFAVFGWAFGGFYVYKLWIFIKSFGESKLITVLLYGIIVLELFNEPLLYSLLFSSIIFFRINESNIE